MTGNPLGGGCSSDAQKIWAEGASQQFIKDNPAVPDP